MKDYTVVVKVCVPECEHPQEAIDYISENIGLSEFNLEINIEDENNSVLKGENHNA